MTYSRRTSLLIITLPMFILGIVSCEKEPSNVGVNLQPDSDEIFLATDTLSVITETVLDNSISSDERSLSLLGIVNESVFGKTEAGFITQIRTSSSNVEEDDTDINPDSIELILDYGGYYGDTLNEISFELYQIKNKDYVLDSTYYSDDHPDPDNLELVNTFSFKPSISDTVGRFVIKDSLFLQQFSDSYLYESDDNFLESFKGLYLKPVNAEGDGCIAYFDLISENSLFKMHHDDTATYDFDINLNCVRINLFEHDYSSAGSELLTSLDNSVNEEYSFLQSAAGLKVSVKVADKSKLDSLADKGINRARLKVSVSTDFLNKFGYPEALTLVYQNDDDIYEFLSDYKASSSHFGGKLADTKDYYTFNIPLYLQDLLENNGEIKVENKLFLFSLKNRVSANHVVINGGNHQENPMQIEVIASEY